MTLQLINIDKLTAYNLYYQQANPKVLRDKNFARNIHAT